MAQALNLLDADLIRIYGEGLNDEQRACLLDPERYDEALDMLDDMEARMGVSGYVRGEVASYLTERHISG